ncbi:MAG: DUF805 domain-containing protein [Kiritimatiellae bacterium]|nr:DUF805 domain-containing protein [Kiritimatiellia bacterium]
MKKVAIVGVEGSGKTVMLAGLGELYSHSDENGYFLGPKNYQTASYVAEKIARMRRGEWPMATADDVMQGLDWTLRQRRGDHERPRDVCEVSCLDFAGEVYRAAFGIRQSAPPHLGDEVLKLKDYIRAADGVIVLINLRDVIVRGEHEPRVQEAMWITNGILSFALEERSGRKAPRAAIVLSQADSYADTIKACGGPKGVLAKYLPHVANNYYWLDIMAVSAVDKTVLDDNGNVVPAPDFQPTQLRMIMDWILDDMPVPVRGGASRPAARRPPPAPGRGERPSPQPHAESDWQEPSGLARFFTFRGRRSRGQYWRFIGFSLLGLIIAGARWDDAGVGFFALLMIWPIYSYAVRRLHDMNISGIWLLVAWIPPIGLVLALMMLFRGGTDGPNSYGPKP